MTTPPDGRRILVTGGATGIGAAAVEVLSGAGATPTPSTAAWSCSADDAHAPAENSEASEAMNSWVRRRDVWRCAALSPSGTTLAARSVTPASR